MTDETKKPPLNKGVQDSEQFDFQPQSPAKPTGRTLKVRKIGNSLGVVLPKDVLAKLKVEEGAELTVTETPDGVALAAAADQDTADLMKLAEEIMAKRRRVLKALAQ